MKTCRWIGTGAFFLLLGSTAPAYAKQDQEEAKPPKQEEKAKPPQEEKAKPPQEEKAPASKPPVKQEEHPQAAKPEEKAPQPAKRQEPTKTAEQPHVQQAKTAGHAPVRTKEDEERQRAAPPIRVTTRTQTRIPDDRFRANFGSAHRFSIGSPGIVGGYSRFQYGGFWFGFVEPWPVGWYYTDQVYVDYVDGGYFLFNPFYPGVRIAITVAV
jgi:hypothetical protein